MNKIATISSPLGFEDVVGSVRSKWHWSDLRCNFQTVENYKLQDALSTFGTTSNAIHIFIRKYTNRR